MLTLLLTCLRLEYSASKKYDLKEGTEPFLVYR